MPLLVAHQSVWRVHESFLSQSLNLCNYCWFISLIIQLFPVVFSIALFILQINLSARLFICKLHKILYIYPFMRSTMHVFLSRKRKRRFINEYNPCRAVILSRNVFLQQRYCKTIYFRLYCLQHAPAV